MKHSKNALWHNCWGCRVVLEASLLQIVTFCYQMLSEWRSHYKDLDPEVPWSTSKTHLADGWLSLALVNLKCVYDPVNKTRQYFFSPSPLYLDQSDSGQKATNCTHKGEIHMCVFTWVRTTVGGLSAHWNQTCLSDGLFPEFWSQEGCQGTVH